MSFAREKRLLLAAAALIVAVPLPFNDVLEWPVLLLYMVVVAAFARRAWQGSERWLSTRALNLLGLAYLPILVVDFAFIGRFQPVRSILHLTLFGLLAKLWSLVRERDKWQAWIGIFFVFLASMATSTHPSVVVYLLAFLAVAIVLLVRFVQLHVRSSFGGDRRSAQLPIGGFTAALVVATVALAVPLFALLPRVRSGFVYGPGLGAEPPGGRAGFTDDLSLDLIGRIRDNPAIALRVRFEGGHGDPQQMRFKAATYTVWEGRSWRRSGRRGTLRPSRMAGSYRLVDEPVVGRAHVVLEPLQSTSLVLPQRTVGLLAPDLALAIDRGGAVVLPQMPSVAIEYDALLASVDRSLGASPLATAAEAGTLDPTGLTPRMRQLAARWAGAGPATSRVEAIERHLLDEYGYSSAFFGRADESPIESFLFVTHRGNCEFFASSMALLLRAVGIPSRVVTGFYGAEWSPWEGAWIVRQSSAHAWVEAWIRGQGWTTYDPTPPDGRPSAEPRSFGLYVRQAWDAVLFRWDRWVISYDFEDQVGVLGRLRALWSEWFHRIFASGGAAPAHPAQQAATAATASVEARAAVEARRQREAIALAAALAAAAAAVGAGFWRRRAAWNATLAYRRLRAALRGGGLEVPDSLPPLALSELAGRRLPEASTETAQVVDSYLREVFGGASLGAAELEELRGSVTVVESVARRLRRRRRRAAVRPAA